MDERLIEILESKTLDEMIDELAESGQLELTEEEKGWDDEITAEDLNEWKFGNDYHKFVK